MSYARISSKEGGGASSEGISFFGDDGRFLGDGDGGVSDDSGDPSELEEELEDSFSVVGGAW